MSVKNKLSHLRSKQGVSAKRLAELVGVQRQTIYAMEAGTYVPNTLVALRLRKRSGSRLRTCSVWKRLCLPRRARGK